MFSKIGIISQAKRQVQIPFV